MVGTESTAVRLVSTFMVMLRLLEIIEAKASMVPDMMSR